MIQATQLKAGVAFKAEGKPYKVAKYELVKMGRGGATVRLQLVNLENGANVEKSFSSNLSFEEINLAKRKLQYLYKDQKIAYFMDERSYEQVEIPLAILGADIYYVKEGQASDVLFWDPSASSGQAESRALLVELPPKVVMKVAETDPGVKGNSASNMYKQAKLENGLSLKVPLFIKTGEKIIVDTRSGEYVERAK